MRLGKHVGLILAFAFLSAGVTAARADLTICNKGENRISVAIVADVPKSIYGTSWTATGWYVIEKGGCKKMIASPNRQEGWLRVISNTDDGDIEYGPISEIVEYNRRFLNSDLEFCVAKDGEPFSREGASPSSLMKCRSNEVAKRFNFSWIHGTRIDFTMTFK